MDQNTNCLQRIASTLLIFNLLSISDKQHVVVVIEHAGVEDVGTDYEGCF